MPSADRESPLYRRVVIKVGSSTLEQRVGKRGFLKAFVDVLAAEQAKGHEIAVVTSGAVACGMHRLNLAARPSNLAEIQAVAAVGQADLMERYRRAFYHHGLECAQILLTHEHMAQRQTFLVLRETLEALFSMEVVPIANENDAVATEELRFGDNDRLAAAFATIVEADLVILLSDIPYLYERDPRIDPEAKPIREVFHIDAQIHEMAGEAGSSVGTGGMASKIQAAELAVEAGIPLLIAEGGDPTIISRILAGASEGTLFHSDKKVDRRRHWMGHLSKTEGVITVDRGASEALKGQAASLLPVGITAVTGHFEVGATVDIADPEGALIARGIVAYDAETIAQIQGLHLDELNAELGCDKNKAVIHRNDLILL